MKKYDKGLSSLVSFVLKTPTLSEALDRIKELDLSNDRDAATVFYKTYCDGNSSFTEAFTEFYRDVKRGNYIFDGEMESMRKFIKENMLVESIQTYQELLDKHDFYYDMGDDYSSAKIGRDMEYDMRQVYKSLNDEEKRQAAILYREKLVSMNFRSGSKYNIMLNNWHPEIEFDPNSFDGVRYKG